MIFFADENFPPRAAKILEIFDPKHQVKAYSNFFDPGTPDIQRIHAVGAWTPKHVVLSGDARVIHNPAELAALKRSEMTYVVLVKAFTQLPWETQAWKIIKAWPSVVQTVETTTRPSVFQITVNEKVEHVATLASLR